MLAALLLIGGVLMLDSYRAHMDPAIRALAWSRGYVVLLHYGCTTGVTQVNDSDLHASFKRIYVSFETDDVIERALVDPGDIACSREQVMRLCLRQNT